MAGSASNRNQEAQDDLNGSHPVDSLFGSASNMNRPSEFRRRYLQSMIEDDLDYSFGRPRPTINRLTINFSNGPSDGLSDDLSDGLSDGLSDDLTDDLIYPIHPRRPIVPEQRRSEMPRHQVRHGNPIGHDDEGRAYLLSDRHAEICYDVNSRLMHWDPDARIFESWRSFNRRLDQGVPRPRRYAPVGTPAPRPQPASPSTRGRNGLDPLESDRDVYMSGALPTGSRGLGSSRSPRFAGSSRFRDPEWRFPGI
ncbi:hypothetical protein B0T11DRAFT_332725 [Plectosphaerella cucumerina]|uniref:Uncharacterized protein n=1 Tax=Plectosphaerella cucumerina TaxID=40658 RepID=A0A8K0T3K8_9PEZI|nr:hypothetical protein B0T11DRAFT_332725 [Plectosphaerella cucumerina]